MHDALLFVQTSLVVSSTNTGFSPVSLSNGVVAAVSRPSGVFVALTSCQLSFCKQEHPSAVSTAVSGSQQSLAAVSSSSSSSQHA